jgi:hypothetical protein
MTYDGAPCDGALFLPFGRLRESMQCGPGQMSPGRFVFEFAIRWEGDRICPDAYESVLSGRG